MASHDITWYHVITWPRDDDWIRNGLLVRRSLLVYQIESLIPSGWLSGSRRVTLHFRSLSTKHFVKWHLLYEDNLRGVRLHCVLATTNSQGYIYRLYNIVGKGSWKKSWNFLGETYKLESSRWNWKKWSWKVWVKLENFWLLNTVNFPASFDTFQHKWKLSNSKLSNLKLPNFSVFPTALSN